MGGRDGGSKERGAVDRGGRGNRHVRGTDLDREVIAGDGVAKVRGSYVGVEVKERHVRIGSWTGWYGKVRGLGIDEEDVAVRATAL